MHHPARGRGKTEKNISITFSVLIMCMELEEEMEPPYHINNCDGVSDRHKEAPRSGAQQRTIVTDPHRGSTY
jgi:hypothetical protein